jgi:hypothetical protein
MNTISKSGGVIYDLLLQEGFNSRFSQWITSQSAHETANFSSDIYNNNFNAFGMKYQGQKTALGEKDGYAYYNSYADSVKDYRRLYKSYGLVVIDTIEGFAIVLKNKKYFEASITEYLAGMKHFLALYFPGGNLAEEAKIHGAGGAW